MTIDAKTLYQGSLRNTHAAETQGLTQMEHQIGRLEHYPHYIALLRGHIETTRGQIARLERAMEEVGTSVSPLRESVTNTAGAVGASVHAFFQDETLKNLYAGYAYQFEQVAAYASLAVIAEEAGFAGHRGWIEQSIREEQEAARGVEALIEPVTRTYMKLTEQGEAMAAKN
jgi:ferritin-like metal-binding protein YciE